MLKTRKNYFFLIIVGIIALSFNSSVLIERLVEGKTIYKVTESSKFVVAGTSTLHDWKMVSDKAEGKANFVIKDGKVSNIKSLDVTLKGETLKSGKDKMDENAYKALKTDKNPNITFKLDRVISIKNDVLRLKGDFTAGGTTKTEYIDVRTKNNSKKLHLVGSFDITFEEYNMTPPTAVMGTIKTGNELSISFDATFINS